MLACVENEERPRVAKPRNQARERVGAANVDGVREEPDGIGRAARAREVDEPDAVRELVPEQARRLDREPALPHAGRTGERHEAVLVQERGERGAELDDARGERVGAEDDRERVDADAGPGENHHADRDRRQAVQAERPAHLRDLRPPDLGGAIEQRVHLLPPFCGCQLHHEACAA